MDPYTQVLIKPMNNKKYIQYGNCLFLIIKLIGKTAKKTELMFFFVLIIDFKRLLLKAEQRSRQLGIGFAPPEETLLSQGVIPMDFSPVSGILSPKKLTKTPEGSPQRIANSGNKLIDVMNKSKDKFSSTKTSSNNSKISSNVNKHQVIESVQKELPSTKVLRHFSTFDKENNDLGIEINIMTPTNIAVNLFIIIIF